MCGRFTQYYTWQELHELYAIHDDTPRNLEPRYNIAPTDPADVIRIDDNGLHVLTTMRWGLVPWWWKKKLKEAPPAFNARAEGIETRPLFRDAFRRNRCIVPASGFYEWIGPKTDRQPHYITRRDGAPMSFAGLWDRWTNPETDERILSCTIVTTAANEWMTRLHDRMPVMLEHDDVSAWLSGEHGTDLLKPAAPDLLQERTVAKAVNSSLNKGGAEMVEPI